MIKLTTANCDEILATTKPVLIKIGAEWCGPCRAMDNVFGKIETKVGDDVVIARADVDEDEDIATRFAVRNIPLILIIKDDEIKYRHVGMVPETDLLELLNAAQ